MRTNRRISRAIVALFVALTSLGAGTAWALTSPTQTRESYVAAVEPICKTQKQSDEKLLSGVRSMVKKGQLKPASAQFAKAATASETALKKIKRVPQPPADAAKLTQWIKLLEEEQVLFAKVGKDLKAENKTKAGADLARLSANGNRANNVVLAFEFNYCRIDSSRFS